jgi:hypothetical protein
MIATLYYKKTNYEVKKSTQCDLPKRKCSNGLFWFFTDRERHFLYVLIWVIIFYFLTLKCTKFSLSNWLYSENIYSRHLKFLEKLQKKKI